MSVIDAGRMTRRTSRQPDAPSVCAASISAGSTLRTVLPMTSTCWKNVPMKMIAIFGPSSMPRMATHNAPNAGAGR